MLRARETEQRERGRETRRETERQKRDRETERQRHRNRETERASQQAAINTRNMIKHIKHSMSTRFRR